jgi:hypothetical protein
VEDLQSVSEIVFTLFFLRRLARLVKAPFLDKSNARFKAEHVAGVPLHLAEQWFHE